MEKIILFAPLVGAIIAGFGWRQIGEKGAMYVTTGLLFLACLLSWIVFLNLGQETQHLPILRWIESGALSTDWSIRCLLYTSPSPRDLSTSRMPSSA